MNTARAKVRQREREREFVIVLAVGITFEAYSPLGNPGRPKRGDDDPSVLDDAVINDIATKHGVRPALVQLYVMYAFILSCLQIAIAFQIHRGIVVLAKSVNIERVKENFCATKVKLDAEDMRRLRELDLDLRFLRFFMVRKDVSLDEFWDKENDKAYVIDEPCNKKNKVNE